MLRDVFELLLCWLLLISISPLGAFPEVSSWLPAAFVTRQEEHVSTEYRLRPRATIDITIPRGTVKIETWNKPFAMVNVTKKARTTEELASTLLKVEHSEARLVIPGEQGPSHVIFDVSLIVPADAATTLMIQEQGAVQVVAAPRVLKVHAQQGDVAIATRTDGTIKAHAEQGNITVTCEAFSPSSSVLATAPQGTITVYLPAMVQARIDAHSHKATIQSQIPITFDPFTTKLERFTWKQLQRHVKGTIGEGEAPITLSARGQIMIRKYEP